jgi:hypothetical protein
MSKLGFSTVLSGFRKSSGKYEAKEAKDINLPEDKPKSVEEFINSAENMSGLNIGNMALECSNLSGVEKKTSQTKIKDRIFKKFISKDTTSGIWISKGAPVSEGKGKEGTTKTTSQILNEVITKIRAMVRNVNASHDPDAKGGEVFNLNQTSFDAILAALNGDSDDDMKRVSSSFEDQVGTFTYAKAKVKGEDNETKSEENVPEESEPTGSNPGAEANGGSDSGAPVKPDSAPAPKGEPASPEKSNDPGDDQKKENPKKGGGLAMPNYLEDNQNNQTQSK